MAWSSRLRPLVLGCGLLAVCAVFGAVVVGQLKDGEPMEGPEAAAAPGMTAASEGQPEMPRFELPPLDGFAELMERPLFSSTRRPTEAEGEPSQTATAPQALDVILTGVIVADDSKVAIIMPRNAAKPVRLNEGQRFQGWTLSEVEPEGVIFRLGTQAQIMALDHKAAAAVAER